MRRRGLMIALIFVLGAGLTTGAFVMRQSGKTIHKKASKGNTVKIAVVKKELVRGIRLSKGDLVFKEWPEGVVTPEFVRSAKEVEGRVIVSNVFPGEPLLKSKLAPEGSAVGLSTLIPRGRRALSIKVNDITGVSGFLLPGSRVDVHATFRIKSKARSKKGEIYLTKTILQDVEVLASGGEKVVGQEKDRLKVPVVTLLLTPEESDKVALAATVAKSIWLSMREPRDKSKRAHTKLVSIDEVLQTEPIRKRTLKRSSKTPKFRRRFRRKGHVVEIIRDGKKTYTKF